MKKGLIIVMIVSLLIIYGTFRIVMKQNFSKGTKGEILQKIKTEFGESIAQNVERIYRLETANFTSGQYHGTFSAGMRSFGDHKYPYGWNTMADTTWRLNPELKPIGVKRYKSNLSGQVNEYVQFKSLKAAMFTLADFLKRRGNNPGRWHASDERQRAQEIYNKKIDEQETLLT